MLLDLLLISRHVPSSSQPHLSSIVLDTLLCILVDAPNSLRSFENVNGVQLVVKILKRAGTPREVRYVAKPALVYIERLAQQDEMP